MVLASALSDILLLADWNTRLVVLGTSMLGVAAGVVGAFLVLRKRALLGDAVSHAMLPGVVGAFLIMHAAGGSGKSFAGLLLGAAIAGTLAALAVPALRSVTGLKDDAVMGVVLGGGFGLGIAMLGVAQALPGGNQAGLESFIYGRTASMVRSDAIGIGLTAVVTLAVAVLLAKELRLLCFDAAFGRSMGRREGLLDLGLMVLAVTVTVVGLQAVGLILVIALLITPAVSARCWTDDFGWMVAAAGAVGAVGCWAGASISAAAPRLPAGAIIVLTLSGFFLVSVAFGARRGVVWRTIKARRLRRRTGQQHLLRAAAEIMESTRTASWTIDSVVGRRSWSRAHVKRLIGRAERGGDVVAERSAYRLSKVGMERAARILRNHRLWELFLIEHADIAATHVDRDADLVEHVLDPEIVAGLEALLSAEHGAPASPHPLGGGG